MKILSCFSDIKEIKPLAAAGAGELYCAVAGLPSFGEPGSLPDLGEFAKAARAAHRLGLKVSVAVNSVMPSFTPGKETRLVKDLAAASAAGADAFIVSNPSIIELLSQVQPRPAAVHLSSVQPCFNSLTAAFFLRLGVSRIILPNQLSPYEAHKILELCRERGVETEIFDYRFFGCAYVNGRCSLHRPGYYTAAAAVQKGSMCRLNLPGSLPVPRTVGVVPELKYKLGGVTGRLADRLGRGGAPRMSNAASFFDYFTAGVGYLKYGTRRDPSEVKVRKVKDMRAMLGLAEELTAALSAGKARAGFIEKLEGWDGTKY
ncbi:MAG: U32 family peptidase [Elusimicrobia bacterium]|nr:U32 family peptidase [Elusimicrobiota bacterium]